MHIIENICILNIFIFNINLNFKQIKTLRNVRKNSK